MSVGSAILIFILILGILSIFLMLSLYNGLVSLRQQVIRAWSNIDVILKQRHDEIPQLIKIIEQFTQYERATIDRVVQARQAYLNARSIPEKIGASKETSQALNGILAIGEAYPELKSNAQFVQLQTRISALEGTLADRRENYNESATNFNTKIMQIPSNFMANMLGYTECPMYTVEREEKTMPSLSLDLPK